MKKKHVKSLRNQLLTITLINILVIAAIIGGIATISSNKLVREKSEQSLKNKSLVTADELNSEMGRIETSVAILADAVLDNLDWEAFTSGDPTYIKNTFIDVLNKVSSSDMLNLANHYGLSDLQYNGQKIISTLDSAGNVISKGLIDTYNNFLGLNIANSPKYYITDGFFGTGSKLLAIAAVLIPVLSALTQWINTKLMPQAAPSDDDKSNAMAASMKSMNIMMPLMSLVFVFSLPIGMGIYWIAGAVIRSIQQIFINKHIDKMDIDAIVAKNTEKLEKKIEKKSGVTGAALNSAARMSTKSLTEKSHTSTLSDAEREEALKKSTEFYNKGVKPGSLAAKANMVKMYNEKNNK